jgi:hypothetical protein
MHHVFDHSVAYELVGAAVCAAELMRKNLDSILRYILHMLVPKVYRPCQAISSIPLERRILLSFKASGKPDSTAARSVA